MSRLSRLRDGVSVGSSVRSSARGNTRDASAAPTDPILGQTDSVGVRAAAIARVGNARRKSVARARDRAPAGEASRPTWLRDGDARVDAAIDVGKARDG